MTGATKVGSKVVVTVESVKDAAKKEEVSVDLLVTKLSTIG